jgi:hypothetical protein
MIAVAILILGLILGASFNWWLKVCGIWGNEIGLKWANENFNRYAAVSSTIHCLLFLAGLFTILVPFGIAVRGNRHALLAWVAGFVCAVTIQRFREWKLRQQDDAAIDL